MADVFGCTFEGYVPTDPAPAPLADSEALIADLPLGDTVRGDLDCPAGRCRVRYRIIAPESGELVVTVSGPGGDETGDAGPRLARAVLEGVGQQTLAARTRGEGPPPFEVRGRVQRGVHYVLIQALGGPVEYEVAVRFTPAPAPIAEAGAPAGAPAPTAAPPVSRRPGGKVVREVVPRPSAAPGDLSDGADFVADPNVDILSLRTYAFAQDPAAMLQGEPGSVKGNVFVLKQIQREIRYRLADMGMRQVAANEAQVLVAIGVGAQSTTWWSTSFGALPQPYEYYFDLWDRPGAAVLAHTYQDGILQIDLIDAKTGDLMWHGWAVEPIPIAGESSDVIAKAVDKVLRQL